MEAKDGPTDPMSLASPAITGPIPAPRPQTSAEQHKSWLALHDTGQWSYRRIARLAGVTSVAVYLAVAKLRKSRDEGPTNREAAGDAARYYDTHPEFRDNRVVQDWLNQRNRPLS